MPASLLQEDLQHSLGAGPRVGLLLNAAVEQVANRLRRLVRFDVAHAPVDGLLHGARLPQQHPKGEDVRRMGQLRSNTP